MMSVEVESSGPYPSKLHARKQRWADGTATVTLRHEMPDGSYTETEVAPADAVRWGSSIALLGAEMLEET